jgi:flagellar biogenesis protein FliO
MLTASFIAIFLIPAMFYLVERFSERKEKKKQEAPGVEVGASHAAGTSQE